jgi:hypothetical protein
MKNLVLFVVAAFGLVSLSPGQIKLQENFETSDSTHLPTGWSKWNQAPFMIDPESHWLVQDTGRAVTGISTTRLSCARQSLKAARVSWVSGSDTNTGGSGQADAWLVTKRIRNIGANDSLIFWAIGGNGGTTGTYYRDTMEVWIDTQDSLPANITFKLATITWQSTDLYGTFKRYAFPVGVAAGNDLFVAFRYFTNVTVDGFVVYLDDVLVKGPLTAVTATGELPTEVSLSQNYPNPFNPSTTIEWSVPKTSMVRLSIYNMIGQEVATLAEATMDPGQYKTTWNPSGLPSGVYLYRLQVGSTNLSRKLVYLR